MNKKNIILSLFFIIFVTLLIYLLLIFFKNYQNKTSFENNILKISEKNSTPIFCIDNITLFSSCNADTSIKQDLTLDNLYQYTDIAIFINNTKYSNTLSAENTLKEVYIDNINFSKLPELGEPELYYKNINNFAKNVFEAENKIDKKINFGITFEDEIDYASPTLYNNCANPISLSYKNNNIKSNYQLNTSNSITYDGSLLKKCNILLDSISCNISFDIWIVNNLNQKFKCPVNIEIPLETESKSLYDGSLILKKTDNITFYRYE